MLVWGIRCVLLYSDTINKHWNCKSRYTGCHKRLLNHGLVVSVLKLLMFLFALARASFYTPILRRAYYAIVCCSLSVSHHFCFWSTLVSLCPEWWSFIQKEGQRSRSQPDGHIMLGSAVLLFVFSLCFQVHLLFFVFVFSLELVESMAWNDCFPKCPLCVEWDVTLY